jgi:hypothetical protein
MKTFLEQVVEQVMQEESNLKDVIFVLPTRLSIVFLKRALSACIDRPMLSPEMLSIEDFVESMSGLSTIDHTSLLFEFYAVYKELTPEEDQEPFERFLSWGPTILQDFNEIDRYLVEPEALFSYLKAIKDLDHWSLSSEPTSLMKSHLQFWSRLPEFYHLLENRLEQQNRCYQGMAYRRAVDQLEVYLSNHERKQHVFLGFNALNKAESLIIQELLQNDLAKIYWDTDSRFHQDPQHAAGMFTRAFAEQWKYYQHHDFNWVGHEYHKQKTIYISAVPKLVGQAKYVGQLLQQLHEQKKDLSSTAVVLGDENLLLPLLNSIPATIEHVNITMGLPLKFVPLASMFEFIFQLHKRPGNSLYYKDVLRVLEHASIKLFLDSSEIIKALYAHNKVYTNLEWLVQQHPEDTETLELLFSNWNNDASKALKNCHRLIALLKMAYDQNPLQYRFDLEYLYKFHSLFNKLSDLNSSFGHFKTIDSLYKIYRELLHSESLDFKGEPLQGLQIMGMLESRALDFETVIICSVNEGILPGGKSQNSVIPYDLKRQYQLPTYKEKDAVYTYHFYRLLTRAREIHLLYNTDMDTLTGDEKSRFITQLEVEGQHHMVHQIVSPEVLIHPVEMKTVHKTTELIEQLVRIGSSGFSPSALSKYVRNPLDYYYQYVLGIKEIDTVEEHVAANTLGTILHEALEELYQDCVGSYLNLELLDKLSKQIPELIRKGFVKHYGENNFDSGKNLISFEVAKRYLFNFIKLEKSQIQMGHRIRIIALEHKAEVNIPVAGVDREIRLKGTVDRIDEFDGQLRIIDYKTGKVNSGELAVFDWEELISDYKKSKAFQLLCYAYMYWKSTGKTERMLAGIISFKNLNSGVLNFGVRSTPRGTADPMITMETLLKFETLTSRLIEEILNLDLPFIEKEV